MIGKVVLYSHAFEKFPQFFVIHTVQGFSWVSEADVDVFLEFPCLFYDNMCWQFDLWFLCLFYTQFVHLEVLGSHTAEV